VECFGDQVTDGPLPKFLQIFEFLYFLHACM